MSKKPEENKSQQSGKLYAALGVGAVALGGVIAHYAFKARQNIRQHSPTVSGPQPSTSAIYTSHSSWNIDTRAFPTSFCCESESFYADDIWFSNQVSDTVSNDILNETEGYTLLKEVDSLIIKNIDENIQQAYNLLRSHEISMTENPEFLWRLAKVQQKLALHHGAKHNNEMEQIFVNNGLEAASRAVTLNSRNAEAHKWFAILTGMTAKFNLRNKNKIAIVLHKHLLIALELEPNDYSICHLLGRFCYEVAKISRLAGPRAAELLNGIIPYEYRDAELHLIKLEQRCPVSVRRNKFLLAKCFVESKDFENALRWLHLTSQEKCKTKDDEIILKEVVRLKAECLNSKTPDMVRIRKKLNSLAKFFWERENYNLDDKIFSESLSEKNKSLNSDGKSEILDEVDYLMGGETQDIECAFRILKSHEFDTSRNPEFLWRFAKAHHKLAMVFYEHNSDTMKETFAENGLKAAAEAMALDSENPNTHKWYAILTGMSAYFAPVTEITTIANTFLKHLLIAIKRNEKDCGMLYLAATFFFKEAWGCALELDFRPKIKEVSYTNSSAVGGIAMNEYLSAEILSPLLPYGFIDSIFYSLEIEKLRPGISKSNRLLLAKNYYEQCHIEETNKWLNLAEEVPCVTKEDKIAHKEVLCLLEQCRKQFTSGD